MSTAAGTGKCVCGDDRSGESSYGRTRDRFDTARAASKYAARRPARDGSHEVRCIRSALASLPAGSHVLDLPCGTGYLTTMLADAGFRVTGADSSSHMIEHAQSAWATACSDKPQRRGRAEFAVQDIMQTTFPDGHFDAIVCNRLFHHFCEPAMRRAALAELRRISSGPVVVFYFDSFALDAIRLASLRLIFGKFQRDRIPISAKKFASEGASVGLQLENVIWTRRGISPQAYAVFRPIAANLPAGRATSQGTRLDTTPQRGALQTPHVAANATLTQNRVDLR
jgi:SAM-dependent methyltransferase